MADTVTTIVLRDDNSHYVIHCTNVSDGTGESAVIKANISTLTMADNGHNQGTKVPVSFQVEKVCGNVMGTAATTLEPVGLKFAFDAATDDTFLYVGGGEFSYDWRAEGGLTDPRSTTFTGDIVVTFDAKAVAGDGYSFTLWLRKKA